MDDWSKSQLFYRVRSIAIRDAGAYLDFLLELDGETDCMLYERGERKTTVREQKQQIEKMLSHDNQMIFLAETTQGLIGHVQCCGGEVRRKRHGAYLVVGVRGRYSTFTRSPRLGFSLAASLLGIKRAYR